MTQASPKVALQHGSWGAPSPRPRLGTNLNPEDVLALMAFEQGPLGRLALQQVGAHGHLATRHVRPEAFTDPPEGQVPTLGRGAHTCVGIRAGKEPQTHAHLRPAGHTHCCVPNLPPATETLAGSYRGERGQVQLAADV